MNYAVILAGGVGSRFWPFSRELEPKQFMELIGGKSLFQSTIERISGVISPENTFIITNSIYFYEVRAQVAKFKIPEANILLEPEGKNTAPAIGLCARLISKKDPDAVLLVLPADHYIKNPERFRDTVKKAINCADKKLLVTIGIKPLKPSTGYGYIKVKNKADGYFCVDKFLEKPSLKEASGYFKDRKFYWNSGMFVWRADVFMEEVKKYLPDLYRILMRIDNPVGMGKLWHGIKPISVDYGIMEHSRRIALIPADFYWTDLGSWDALGEVFPKDKKGNVFSGDVLNLGSEGIGVFSRSRRLICPIGVKDLVVADTPDALLICDRNQTQQVKNAVEMLKTAKRREHLVHLTERRPWGSFTVLEAGAGFKIKLIEISPHRRISLQRHKKRAEHWVVVSGVARVISGTDCSLVHQNESIYIPKGIKHRLENNTDIPLKIVEVQTGNYLEEDDIERFEDDFRKECR